MTSDDTPIEISEREAEVFIQPKITGYRQLTPHEAGLMNEAKALGAAAEDLVKRLKAYHQAQRVDAQVCVREQGAPESAETFRLVNAEPERWLAMGRTDIQIGVMKIVRSIAQPAS
jgi:xanthine dehydrogenase iron-sulfur cluster and FAD-binding subunit A